MKTHNTSKTSKILLIAKKPFFRQFTVLLLLSLIIFSGCLTYYQKNLKFNSFVYSGDFKQAKEILDKNKKAQKNHNKLLYLLNSGWLDFMLANHSLSNQAFQQAERLIEDYQKNYALDALSLISNPMVKPYFPEDFEPVMLNYYIAMNYLLSGDYSEAIIECRRMNIKLNQLNDKYKDHKNRYQQDAFANLLMGLIFETTNDYNNAFIAYRNALDIYENDYSKNFNINPPLQLIKDLIRMAYYNGFFSEASFYEQKYNINYSKEEFALNKPELIFFWHNGFAPVKAEWSINFIKTDAQGGWINFSNDELGLNFPFYIGNYSDSDKSAFANLKMARIAFPKYVERIPLFNAANIEINNSVYSLEKTQNINEIAFKTLKDRMLREMSNSLIRLASKQALQYITNKQNENIGSAISIINAITEKADTRNWQTLPYDIFYSRIPLEEGDNTIKFTPYNSNSKKENILNFKASKGQKIFFSFSSLETLN